MGLSKLTLVAKIHMLAEKGVSVEGIAQRTRRPIRAVRHVLANRISAFVPLADLEGVPTISDEALTAFGDGEQGGFDEAKVTAEIYAAAEAIRQRRPREPIGYRPAEVLIPVVGMMGMERRTKGREA